MLNLFEKIYIILRLMQICRQNEKRQRFYEKYSFDDYGEDLASAHLVKCILKQDGLYLDGTNRAAKNRKCKDQFGIVEYVNQKTGYCEDDYYGMIYRKTPLRNLYIRTPFEC